MSCFHRIAIIGGGPAGFMSALTAVESAVSPVQINIFEAASPLKTILYTGNGRCNLSNDISDFKELASKYPRGEKFLYSVFSRLSVPETMKYFNSRGLKTYVQPDGRIFPKTNKAATVRDFFLVKTAEKDVKIINSAVEDISRKDNLFIIKAGGKVFKYDAVIIATGGNRKLPHSGTNSGFKLANKLGHTVTELRPSLTSLHVKEPWVGKLAGVSVKNAFIESFFHGKKISSIQGDFVFTHRGLAGPAVFNTSAYCACLDYSAKEPLLLQINFIPELDYAGFAHGLATQGNKTALNALKEFVPKSLVAELLTAHKFDPGRKVSGMPEKDKEALFKMLSEAELTVTSPAKDGEIVTAGGVVLNEVNPATMGSKLVKGLFFCGEVLDIDGLTGGFNLQMCWSTGYLAGLGVLGAV